MDETAPETARHEDHILSLIESFDQLISSCPNSETSQQQILDPCRHLVLKAFKRLIEKYEYVYHNDFEFYHQLKMASNGIHLKDNIKRLQTDILPTLQNSIVSFSKSLEPENLKKEPVLKLKSVIKELEQLEDSMDAIQASFYNISEELHDKIKDIHEPAKGFPQHQTQCLVWKVTNIQKYVCCDLVQAGLDLVKNFTFPPSNVVIPNQQLLSVEVKRSNMVLSHKAKSIDLIDQLCKWFQLPEPALAQDCLKLMADNIINDWDELLNRTNPDRLRFLKSVLLKQKEVEEKKKAEEQQTGSTADTSNQDEESRKRPPIPSEDLIKACELVTPLIKMSRLLFKKFKNFISIEGLFPLMWNTINPDSKGDKDISDTWLSEIFEILRDLPPRPHIESLRIRFEKLFRHDPDDPGKFPALGEVLDEINGQYSSLIIDLSTSLNTITEESDCPEHLQDECYNFQGWCAFWGRQFFTALYMFNRACSNFPPPQFDREPNRFPFGGVYQIAGRIGSNESIGYYVAGSPLNQVSDGSGESDGTDDDDGSDENDGSEDSDGSEGSDGSEDRDGNGDEDDADSISTIAEVWI